LVLQSTVEKEKTDMEIVQVVDGQISLPSSVTKWSGVSGELSMFIEGDTLILKRIGVPKLSEFAARTSGDEMPLDEIVAEVHRHRQENKDRAGRS